MGEICENCGLPVSDTAAGCENPEVAILDTVTTRGQDILAGTKTERLAKEAKDKYEQEQAELRKLFHYCENGGVALKDRETVGSVRIPDDAKYIGNAGPAGCKKVTEVIIPNGVAGIGDAAFSNWIGLTSITIPSSVTKIGGSAFQGCTGLTDITISDGVAETGWLAFEDCTGLTSIHYTGTKRQWKQLSNASRWNSHLPIKAIRCINGKIRL